MIHISVGSLLHKEVGAVEHHHFDVPFIMSEKGDPQLSSNVKGSIKLLKLPHEINVNIQGMSVMAKSICSRCLKHFEHVVKVPSAEREFIIDLPRESLEQGEEVYYVGKNNEIDLDDMVRAEILLHFPPVPVCSESCKGLCDKCGVNLNMTTCSCQHNLKSRNSPFKFI